MDHEECQIGIQLMDFYVLILIMKKQTWKS